MGNETQLREAYKIYTELVKDINKWIEMYQLQKKDALANISKIKNNLLLTKETEYPKQISYSDMLSVVIKDRDRYSEIRNMQSSLVAERDGDVNMLDDSLLPAISRIYKEVMFEQLFPELT